MRLEGVSPQPGVALQVSLTKVKKNSLPFLDNKVLFTYVGRPVLEQKIYFLQFRSVSWIRIRLDPKLFPGQELFVWVYFFVELI